MSVKVINLDKFRTFQKVSIEGKEYEVRGITVKQFVDEGVDDVLKGETPKEQVENLVTFLTKITTIPVEVLKAQDINVLNALVAISRGGDPEKEKDAPNA